MIIPCVACQTRYRLDSSLIKADGSRVRCSKCREIFMVYPLDDKIKQPVEKAHPEHPGFDDLEKRNASMAASADDESTGESHTSAIEKESLVEGPDTGEFFRKAEGFNYAELPDLSELENMIDWDDVTAPEDELSD